jgi:hydrogenase/urease accessory protein HupE
VIVRIILFLAALFAIAPAALAHEIRPAFLQIREIEPGAYDILWKTPAQGDMRLALNVTLPANCANAGDPRTAMVDGAVIQTWRAICKGGLVGQTLAIENLSQTLTDTIIRYEPLEGRSKSFLLKPDRPFVVILAQQPWTDVGATYFGLGVEHILLGFDHLMFVLALLILVGDTRRLLAAVTAFTVAHSLTLAGTTLGWIRLASAPVEAMIALSIMFVAVEIMRVRAGRESLAARLPWLASFAFGLLHGFGFAGALREIGIPDDAVGLALLFFNLGVEAGQILFIAGVLAVLLLWRQTRLATPAWSARAPVYVVGCTAAFWFIERTAAIFLA